MRRLILLTLVVISAWAQSNAILSQSQVQQLETKVAQNPADRQSQTILGQNYAFFILGITSLGQYDVVTGVDLAKARSDFAQHARDVFQNSTLGGVLGEGGKALWNFSFLVQSYQVLQSNAGVPYLEARTLGSETLDRAIFVEPVQPTWRYYRIPITVLRSDYDFMHLNTAEAYRLVKEDLSLLTGMTREAVLAYGAKLAVKADALDDAQSFALELLNSAANPDNWNYGNAIFFGHMVLGQVALRQGNLSAAQSRLLASGKTPGSPTLNSFGPNMSLAKDLLTGVPVARGRAALGGPHVPRRPTVSPDVRQTVLEFFDLCKVFWDMDNGRLQKWSQQVQAGIVPDFGANLYY